MNQERVSVARLLAAQWVALLLTACFPETEPTNESDKYPVESLQGTQGVVSLLGGAFSISPDGRFLFGTNYDLNVHPVVVNEAIRRGFIYELQQTRKLDISWSADATNLVLEIGLLEESGCWRDSRLFLATPFPPRSIWLDADADSIVWNVTNDKPCQREPLKNLKTSTG